MKKVRASFFFLFCAGIFWASEATPDSAAKLKALQSSIAEEGQKLSEFQRSEKDLLELLEKIDRRDEQFLREVKLAQSKLEKGRRSLRKLGKEIAVLQKSQHKTQQALAKRAVVIYETGDWGILQFLFSSESFSDFLLRSQTLELLMDQDRSLLLRAREQDSQLKNARSQNEKMLQSRSRMLVRLKEQLKALEGEREQRKLLLARVKGDRVQSEQLLSELKLAARKLEEMLESLSSGKADQAGGISFVSQKGSLPFPVDAQIVSAFGRTTDRQFLTHTFRKGIDFKASEGTWVRAVAGGEVRYAGWFRGYGKLVILDHGEKYFTVSGHLSEIKVARGDRVLAGDLIGKVGTTGSLLGPRLYFEIRHAGDPLNPKHWLRARAKAKAG